MRGMIGSGTIILCEIAFSHYPLYILYEPSLLASREYFSHCFHLKSDYASCNINQCIQNSDDEDTLFLNLIFISVFWFFSINNKSFPFAVIY